MALFAGMAVALERPFLREEPGVDECSRVSRFLWACDIFNDYQASRDSLSNATVCGVSIEVLQTREVCIWRADEETRLPRAD